MAGKQWNNMDELRHIRGGGSYREIIPPVLATTPIKKRIIKPAGQFRNLGNVQLNGLNG